MAGGAYAEGVVGNPEKPPVFGPEDFLCSSLTCKQVCRIHFQALIYNAQSLVSVNILKLRPRFGDYLIKWIILFAASRDQRGIGRCKPAIENCHGWRRFSSQQNKILDRKHDIERELLTGKRFSFLIVILVCMLQEILSFPE